MAVAIDGPAAAGKSTVAKKVAGYFNYLYIDTGAMYRAFAWYAVQNGVDPASEKETRELLPSFAMDFQRKGKAQRVFVGQEDVTEAIRTKEMGLYASAVAVHPPVRHHLVALQREMAAQRAVVMDGRDIGTNVLPNADVKIFLVASPEERAERRWKEYQSKGQDADLALLLEDIRKRDKQDMERKVAPLKKASDAIEVDTTAMPLDDVVARIVQVVKQKVAS
ncbi:(d)CMP kinase [Bacillaceae bacterium SIJ1]|nr:(d)CMP kinase [Litoribacterium kuwaitense]